MADLFKDNAYNVLGIESSSTQKDVNKRAKEISNLLKIDEIPSYDADIPIIEAKRSDRNIQLALQKLSSHTKKISEYFLWFDVNDDKDAKAVELIRQNDTSGAQAIWVDNSKSETAKGFISKKNLAILFTILIGNGSKSYLNRSLHLWDSIVESDKFWDSYVKIYQLNDDLGTSSEIIKSFRKQLTKTLSDYYADLSKDQNDNSYISEFSKTFNIKSEKVEKDVLGPIFESINEASGKLSSLQISKEKIISDKKLAELKKLVIVLRNNFKKLKEVGFYSDSQSKTMRDKAAEALRSVSLDLFNNLNEASKSLAITKIALEIVGTEGLKSRLQSDLNYLTKNIKHERVIKPINELLESEDWEGAFEHIDRVRKRNADDKELNQLLDNRTKWAITGYVGDDFAEAKRLYDKKKYADAAPIFEDNVHYIMENIAIFDFNQEGLQEVLNEANRLSSNVTQQSASQVDNYRNKVVQDAQNIFGDQFEQAIVVMLIDSIIMGNVAAQIPKLKQQRLVKQFVSWGVVIAIFAIIGAVSGNNNSSNNSSNSSGSNTTTSAPSTAAPQESAAQQQACSQATSLQSEISSDKSMLTTYANEGDSYDYNNLLSTTNNLINQYNSLVPVCNGTSP